MAVLSGAWGMRLTYNFARKGGYTWRGEDYRWAVVRRNMHPAVFQIFNVFFIVIFQNLLLMAQALPAYVAWRARAYACTWLDCVAAVLFAGCLLLETVTDEHQWQFQLFKQRVRNSSVSPAELEKHPWQSDAKRGFATRGVFRFSRHPNFFAEISTWYCFYLFSVAACCAASSASTTSATAAAAATNPISSACSWCGCLNWTITGAVFLHGLVHLSTNFTETLSLPKYPQYPQYQRITSRLIPWPPAGELSDPTPELCATASGVTVHAANSSHAQ